MPCRIAPAWPVSPPPASSYVARERGFALLRAEESPAYWESPAPAVAFQLATYYVHYAHDAFSLLGFHAFNRPSAAASFFAFRPPLKRSTANRPAGSSRTATAVSDGLGTASPFNFAGSTNAIVAFESLPDMNTGVVMAIFCFPSFPPVMNRNKRVKLPSLPSRLPAAMDVSTTVSAG